MQLTGIHHLTAITARARENHAFYTQVLGMRLVKKTVNQDDTSAYHLFYADGKGSPGTDLTFFDWPAARERRGTHSIVRTGLRVRGECLSWWRERLASAGVAQGGIVEEDGRRVLPFEDPEGQRLALIEDGEAPPEHPWARSPVPAEHQIRGLGPIVMSVPALEATDRVVTEVMGMRRARSYARDEGEVQVYAMGPGGPGAELHVLVEPGAAPAGPGAGGVHHVAFRTPDGQYEAWAERLRALRVPSSGPVDRFYFRSLYFREPNGILFEIATDGPGFSADEPEATMGERLALPPFLEPRRAAIEAGLKPL
ncbi:MAG TPA: ring-cleaving dioxygenase [Beijerinckiaceae bacterium]|nr:ring-cleaving dioxygenase [Beijerinckiaceae bacterium]